MGWWKTAKVGDKVVCVATANVNDHGLPPAPHEVGRVYEIREIFQHDFANCGVALWFGAYRHGRKSCFGADLFRPVAKRSSETGVAALKQHLKTAPVRDRITTPDFAKAGDL